MTDIDDFYRSLHGAEISKENLLLSRQRELWSKIITEVIPRKIALHLEEKSTYHLRWVSVGSEVVATWGVTWLRSCNRWVVLFQDKTLGLINMHGVPTYETPAKLIKKFGGTYVTDGLRHEDISIVLESLLDYSPVVEEAELFKMCLLENWKKKENAGAIGLLMHRFHVE